MLSANARLVCVKRFNVATPLVYFENRWLQMLGPRLDVTPPSLTWGAGSDHELKGGVGVNMIGFGGYKASDAPILYGMENRRPGIFTGPLATNARSAPSQARHVHAERGRRITDQGQPTVDRSRETFALVGDLCRFRQQQRHEQ